MPEGKSVDLKVESNDFNISTLGSILPFIHKQKGLLNSDISIGGDISNVNIAGDLIVGEPATEKSNEIGFSNNQTFQIG